MLIEFVCERGGEKILKYISRKHPEISYSKLNMLLRKKEIRVNGKRINENLILNKNDAIQLYISSLEEKKTSNVKIFYEDENIIVVDKAQDIETEGENSLSSMLAKEYKYVKACHRLDRNTVGLLVFALNQQAYQEMYQAFEQRTVKKEYTALCWGIFEEKSKRLNAFLFKDRKKSMVYISDKNGKGYVPIITEYSVIEEFHGLSMVKVNLITGRTHQIRAHMAHIGHFVMGDGKYGKEEINRKYNIKKQQLYASKLVFNFSNKSLLHYLNSINFENKMYEKDILELKEELGAN